MTARRRRVVFWSAAGLVVLLALATCFGVWIPGIDVLLYLVVGWIPYLSRVVPQVRVRWDLVASAAVYATALTIGAQGFFRWLHREMHKTDAAADPQPPWKWRWTLAGLSMVVLAFAAGIAMVGIVHQSTWLLRSPESLYRRGGSPLVHRSRCRSTLEFIGRALKTYAKENGGRFPDDFRQLIISGGLTGDLLICPESDDEPAFWVTATQPSDDVFKPGHCSYVYLGKGLTGEVDPRRVVIVEPLENHRGDGINVLHADGSAHWVERPQAEKLLTELGFERIEPKPR